MTEWFVLMMSSIVLIRSLSRFFVMFSFISIFLCTFRPQVVLAVTSLEPPCLSLSSQTAQSHTPDVCAPPLVHRRGVVLCISVTCYAWRRECLILWFVYVSLFIFVVCDEGRSEGAYVSICRRPGLFPQWFAPEGCVCDPHTPPNH